MRICYIALVLIISMIFFITGCSTYESNVGGKTYIYNQQAAIADTESALSYLKQGYTDVAFNKLQQALRENPYSTRVLAGAGYCFEKMGDTAAAKSYYGQALIQGDDKISAEYYYGTFLCRQGQLDQSIIFLTHAANNKAFPVPLRADAYANAAYCTYIHNHWREAHHYSVIALHFNPVQGTALLILTEHALLHHQYDPARLYLMIYDKSNPGTPWSRFLHVQLDRTLYPGKNTSYHRRVPRKRHPMKGEALPGE